MCIVKTVVKSSNICKNFSVFFLKKIGISHLAEFQKGFASSSRLSDTFPAFCLKFLASLVVEQNF